MEIVKKLEELELFEGLRGESLRRLADSAEMRIFEAKRMIFNQGDRAKRFYVLIHGLVKLFTGTTDGKEHTLYVVEEKEPFCICTIFGMKEAPLGALSLARSRILSFPDDLIRKVAYEEPQLLVNVLKVYNKRLLSSMHMIEDLALRDIYQRMASYLLHALGLSGDDSSHVRLTVPRQELARILGTTPETVSRVLARMTAEGLVEARGRQIRLLDQQSLEDIAG